VDERILEYAVQCYGISRSDITPMSGGHDNYIYEFHKDDRDYVLRINIGADANLKKGMIEWVNYLADRAVPVSKSLLSKNNNALEAVDIKNQSVTIAAFEKAPGKLAETIPEKAWNAGLYQSLGKAVGRMHVASKTYYPSTRAITRPFWNQISTCFNQSKPLDEAHATVQEDLTRLITSIKKLPEDKDSFGLVHADLHLGNFFVEEKTGQVSLFDFDDCCYGWFAMDIVLPLFDILVVYNKIDNSGFAQDFFKNFIIGYRSEHHIDDIWFEHLPKFLKLLEISIYTMLYKDNNTNDATTWPGKFMPGRKTRIEKKIPYIDIDFRQFT